MATQERTIKGSPLQPLLEAVPHTNLDEARDDLLETAQGWRKARLEQIRSDFEQDGDTRAMMAGLTSTMDECIACFFRLLMPGSLGVSVVATGGYGRGEQFPYSDVDLLILYRPAARAPAERMARFLLYILWDLGIKVGHALRSVEETIQFAHDDLTIRTSLVDARLVVGDAELYEHMQERFRDEIVRDSAVQFAEMKLAERDERHKRLGDSRYLLEPNLKESKGGLRDLHTLHWIARYVYGISDISELVKLDYLNPEEQRAFERARDFLWRMRAHLHYVAGKPEERLTFDRQQQLAPRMGFRDSAGSKAVERMMRRYFMAARAVGSLTRILCALLEEQHKRKPRQPLALRMASVWKLEGFTLDGERLQVKSEDEFEHDPIRMLKLFQVAQRHGYDIHPRSLQLVARNLKRVDAELRADSKANAIFMEILLSGMGPEQTLRRMNDVGLLGRFIPDFGRIVGQMQFNMYHVYTVDEHTIVALGILHGLERGKYKEDMPLASEVVRRVQSRRVLYLALLCHDIAKGRGGDHSEIGAVIAARMSKRFGFSIREADTASWLVQYHLLLTHTAFKRDASDPQALTDFVNAVKTIERLRLLLALTVADVRAVAPGVWNAWKATLLRNLFLRAETYMRDGRMPEAEAPTELLQQVLLQAIPQWKPSDADDYLSLATGEYLTAITPDGHARVAMLLQKMGLEHSNFVLDAQHDLKRSITELTIVTPDQQGLFSRLAGAISLTGGNIVSAKIFTLKNGMAVDVFYIQDADGKVFDQTERLARMSMRLRQSVNNEIDLAKELAKQRPAYASRRDAFAMEGQVFIENDASATHTVVEVVGRDRIGFLYAVTSALSEMGLMIGSAHISTYGAQAVDVFYVKDTFGLKVLHEKKQEQLREALLAAINDRSAAAA